MPSVATVCRKALRALSVLLYRSCRSLAARPRATLIAFLALNLLFAANLPRIRFLFSAQDMVGEGIPSADELQGLRDRYEDGTASTLFITPADGRFSFTQAELCGARKWYSVIRTTSPEMKNTVSTFDVKWPVRVGAERVKYQSLLQLDCEPGGAPADLRRMKDELERSPWVGLKDSKDRLSLVFSFVFKDAPHSSFGSFDPRVITPLRKTAEEDLQALLPGARMRWVGLGDYQWYVRRGFQFALLVNTAMVILLLVSLRWLYGTWLAGLIFCATLIIDGIWIYGAKALAGSPYDILSSGIFLILGVSSIEDFTFLSSEQLRGASLRQATRRLLVPSFFTSLTTVIGFASLCTSDLAVIRRFGSWCAGGALLEWLMLFGILPALLSRRLPRTGWVDPARARAAVADRLSGLRPARWVSLAALLVFPLALGAFQRLEVNDDPSAVFPGAHPYNEGLRALREAKGWQGTASLLWDAPPPDQLSRTARKLQDEGAIAGFETADRAIDWLARPGALSREEAAEDFKSSLQYHQLVDGGGNPRATLYLDAVSVRDIQGLEAKVRQVCPVGQCHAAGDLVAYSDFSTFVPRTLIDSMGLSLLLVALVIGWLCLAFGHGRSFAALVACSSWGACLMIVALVALRIPMNFLNSTIASVLVGLTGDNAVQYLFAARRGPLEGGIRRRASASVLTNSLMALTSLMYLLSYFKPPKSFGLILAAGLMATLFGDLWLLNGLLGLRTARAPRARRGPGPSAPASPRG